MIELRVPNMNCGHCVATITRAVQTLAPEAKLDIALAEKRVRIESAQPEAALIACIREAGFDAEKFA